MQHTMSLSPPGSRHGALATRIAALLHRHVGANRLGGRSHARGILDCNRPRHGERARRAFVRAERMPSTGIPDGFWPGPPDLAVEIRSPRDRRATNSGKVRDYLARGVRTVWVVDPKKKTVTVHRGESQVVTLGMEDQIDAKAVVPGFTCAVRQLFE